METPLSEQEKHLWKMARKRVGFKRNLTAYVVVNIMLWLLYLVNHPAHGDLLPWPVWPMFGWGIGLAFSYFDAYGTHKNKAIEREYEKLKNS